MYGSDQFAKVTDAATPSLMPPVVATAEKAQPKSKESTLIELKALFDKGLITKENYEEQQKKVLRE